MKKFKGTFAFFFVVALFFVYVVFEYKNEKKTYETKEEAKSIFPGVSVENLKEFKFVGPNLTLFLRKKAKTWLVESPVETPADQEFVESLLKQLLSDSLQLISSEPLSKKRLKEYGLDNPLLQIGFKQESGDFLDVIVSQQNSFNGKAYLKRVGEDKVFVVSSLWQDLSQKKLYDFRWKNLYVHLEPMQTVVFKKDFNKKVEFSYDPQKQKWQAGHDKSLEVSREDMGLLVDDLTRIKAFRFLSEEKNEKILKKYGLYSPQFELEFYFRKTNIKKWSLKISKEDRGKFYAILDGRPSIFQLNEPELNKLKAHFNRLQ